MKGLRGVIVALSAVAALAVGLTSHQPKPQTTLESALLDLRDATIGDPS